MLSRKVIISFLTLAFCLLSACVTPNPTTTNTKIDSSVAPVQVISVVNVPLPSPATYPPGDGGQYQIKLKNISDKVIISLKVLIEEPQIVAFPFEVDFGVGVSNAFAPGKVITATPFMIGPRTIGPGIPYYLTVSGTFQDGETFSFRWDPPN